MVKHVVDGVLVIHLWAHQSLDYANNGRNGNVSFQGTVLTSYSIPIANIVTDRHKRKVALISERTYSPTTATHVNTARYAVRGVMPAYRVPFVGATGARLPSKELAAATDPKQFHAANVSAMLEKYKTEHERLMRALRFDQYGEQALADLIAAAKTYAERFAVDRRKIRWPDTAADWQQVVDREAARKTPEKIAKREKAAEQRAALDRANFIAVRGKYGIKWRAPWRGHAFTAEDQEARNVNLRAYWQQYIADHRERFVADPYWRPECREDMFSPEDKAARAERLRVCEADTIAAWYAGASVYLSRGEFALLRVRGNEIETSWGARFPAEHGRKAFPLLARIRARGEEWHRAFGHSIHLGHFSIDRVTADGTVYAGCHKVAWSDIERVARELLLEVDNAL